MSGIIRDKANNHSVRTISRRSDNTGSLVNSFERTDDEQAMSNMLTTRNKEITSLSLKSLIKAPEGFLKPYWDVVLECKDYVYKHSGNMTSKGQTIGDLLAQAKRANRDTKKGQEICNRASSVIRTIISQYFEDPSTKLTDSVKSQINLRIMNDLVIEEVIGLSVIQFIWNDKKVEEVWIDGPNHVNINYAGRKIWVRGASFRDADHLTDFCNTVLKQAEREDLTMDSMNPNIDTRLKDLSRVAIESQRIVPGGPIVAIRRHPSNYVTISDLVNWGTCTKEMWEDIAKWCAAGLSILVVGEVGSGKTFFLDAMSGLFPNQSRIMTIEDNLELELNPNKPFKVPGGEARLPNRGAEGSNDGSFSIRDHVKATLRFTPDIVVIGEVRDKAAYDLVNAANTGYTVYSTLHANSPEDTIIRLQNLISMDGSVVGSATLSMIASAFDLIVHVGKLNDGSRKILSISEIDAVSKVDKVTKLPTVQTWPIWKWNTKGYSARTGRIVGSYDKVHEISKLLQTRHNMSTVNDFTWDDCLDLEGFRNKSTRIPQVQY